MSIQWWEKTIHDLPWPSLTFLDLPWPSMTFHDLLWPSMTFYHFLRPLLPSMIKCLLSRPGLIAGPLHSTPLPNNSQSFPRLDPINSQSSSLSKITSSTNPYVLHIVLIKSFYVIYESSTLSLPTLEVNQCFIPRSDSEFEMSPKSISRHSSVASNISGWVETYFLLNIGETFTYLHLYLHNLKTIWRQSFSFCTEEKALRCHLASLSHNWLSFLPCDTWIYFFKKQQRQIFTSISNWNHQWINILMRQWSRVLLPI